MISASARLDAVGNASNFDEMRKRQIVDILNKEQDQISEDNVVFVKHGIKNFTSAQNLQWLEQQFNNEQQREIIRTMKFQEFKEARQQTYSKTDEIPIYFIKNGISLFRAIGLIQIGIVKDGKEEQIIKRYQNADLVFFQVTVQSPVQVSIEAGTNAFEINRTVYNKLQNSAENLKNEQKIKNISRSFPRFRRLDATLMNVILPKFVEVKKSQGSVITVPQHGTTDLLLIQKGLIVIIAPNYEKKPINPQYKENFIIVGCHRDEGIINEAKILFDQDLQYGYVVIGGESTVKPMQEILQIYSIDRASLDSIEDDEVLQILRGNFKSKDRLYKGLLDRIKPLNAEDTFELQKKICQKYSINFEEVKQAVIKNTKNGIIHSSDREEQQKKNLEKFSKIMGDNPLRGALQTMTDKERTLCFGTPRIVQKNTNFMGMSAQQESSLFALRQMGTNLRMGQATTNSILPVARDQIEKAKNSLLDQEREQVAQLVSKKSVAQKLMKEEPGEEKTITKKLNRDQNQLMKELSEKVESTEVVFSMVKQEQPSQQLQVEESKIVEFQGRTVKRQNSSSSNQTPKEIEIANKRKAILKLGI